MINNGKLLGILLLVLGSMQLFPVLQTSGISYNLILGISMMIYGLINVFINLGRNRRAWLLLGNFLFFAGIYFVVSDFYKIIEKDHIFITLFFFIFASGFWLLFLDNTKEKVFLGISLFLFALSFLSEQLVNFLSHKSEIAAIGYVLMGYWPVFLVLFGIAVLLGRKK